jgi:hypothetical protein
LRLTSATQLPSEPFTVSVASPLESVLTVPFPTSQDCSEQKLDVWFHDVSWEPDSLSSSDPA